MKKTLLLLTLAALLLVGCADMDSMSGIPVANAPATAQDAPTTVVPTEVISQRLADAFAQSNGEEQRVILYIKGEEPPSMREQMKNREPATTQDPALTEPEKYRNQHAVESMQEVIMEMRNASKEAHLSKNNAFVEQYLDADKVEYVSLFSFQIIARLDADDVNALAKVGEVARIDLYKVDVAPIAIE